MKTVCLTQAICFQYREFISVFKYTHFFRLANYTKHSKNDSRLMRLCMIVPRWDQFFFVFVVDYATILNIDWHRCLNLRFLQPSKFKENNPTSVQHFACDPWNNYQPRLPATIITTHIIRGKVSNWGPRYEISVKPSKTTSMWYRIKMVRTATSLLKQPYKK